MCTQQTHADTRPIPQDSLFTHAKFPVLCYSKLQSSLVVLLPTESDWSPLLPQCMPGWGPQWPLASAECPRSAPDGHHLKIVQMGPVSTLLSGCDALVGTWSVSKFSLHVHYCLLCHYRKKNVVCVCVCTVHQLTGCTDVTGRVRCPRNAIDTGTMVIQPSHWGTWHPHI